jgi:tetratricopeptide (TPR) repeat protein
MSSVYRRYNPPLLKEISMFMMQRGTAAAVLALVLSLSVAFAQHDQHGAAGERLGTVSFKTSCKPAVQVDFNRAVALLHSFEFREAIGGFDKVLEADATCAIAQWGRALAFWGNPFAPGIKGGKPLQDGRAAAAAGRAIGSPTPRERSYIDAVGELYKNADTVGQRERTAAYEQAMEKVARANPDDMEATIFYALAVNQTALPTDKTYVKQLKAVSLLEPLLAKYPDHPGLAHYVIHAYDHPPLAPRALDAARRYSKIAPSAPHALHMPSHTFTRVGYWQESIDTNIASAETALKQASYSEALHAMDYQTYAYLQTAQDAAAKRVVDRVAEVAAKVVPESVTGAAPSTAGFYALAAIPARYALERGAWQEAAQLTASSSPTPYADAITHFARAVGLARSGNPSAATRDLEQLAALRDKLSAANEPYWAGQVEIQRKVADAWVAFASNRRDDAIAALRAAAEAEDATDKAAVTPGPLAPAREQLAEALLEAKRAKEALTEFQATLGKEPNRYRALAGAARAADAAGDASDAAEFYKQLLKVCARADTERPELARAKRASNDAAR